MKLHTSCYTLLNTQSPCKLSLSWYSDFGYTSLKPYVTISNSSDVNNITNGLHPLSYICGNNIPVPTDTFLVKDFQCDIYVSADYTFELHKDDYDVSLSATVQIAESNQLKILPCLGGSCQSSAGEPLEPQTPTLADDRNLVSDSTNDEVGLTSGSFSVDGSGGASYSIPVFAPSGRGGLSPDVALNYSSQAGNGIAGIGWNIAGISSISRCLKNKEQDPTDAYYKPITMTNADAFCLDGSRLYIETGSENGAHNVTYRTELESFSRVTSLNTAGNGPSEFQVEAKNGDIRIYGSPSDKFKANSIFTTENTGAQILSTDGTGTVVTWLLNKVKDRNGNEMWFVWDTKNGESYLKQIRWTMDNNTVKEYKEHYRIDFNYIDRTADKMQGYQIGNESKIFKLLDNITTSIRATTSTSSLTKVRELNLSYNTSASQQKRLSQVEECAFKDAVSACHQPVVFEWDENNTYDLNLNNKVSTTNIKDLANMGFGASKPIDINGDGKMELIFVKGYDDGNIIIQDLRAEYYILSNDTTDTEFTGEEFVMPYEEISPVSGCNNISYSTGNAAFNKLCAMGVEPFDPDHENEKFGSESWFVYDFNGDGFDDILSPKAQANQDYWWIFYSNGKRICSSGTYLDENSNLRNEECEDYQPLDIGIEYHAVAGGSSLLDYTADGLVDFITFANTGTIDNPVYKYKLFPMILSEGQYSFGSMGGQELTFSSDNLKPRDFLCPKESGNDFIECIVNYEHDVDNLPIDATFGENGYLIVQKLNIVPSDFNGDGYNDALLNYTYQFPDHMCGIESGGINPYPQRANDGTYQGEKINNKAEDVVFDYKCQQKFSAVMLFNPVTKSFKYAGRAGIINIFTDGDILNDYDFSSNVTCDEASDSNCKGYIHGDKDSIRVMDVNGDGLSDIVYRGNSGNNWHYKLNLGTKSDKTQAAINLTSFSGNYSYQLDESSYEQINFSAIKSFNLPSISSGNKDIDGRKYLIQFIDYDYDGDMDILYPQLEAEAGATVKYIVRKYNTDTPYATPTTTNLVARLKADESKATVNQFFDLNGDSYYDQFIVYLGDDSGNGKNSSISYNTRPWKTRNKITAFITGGSHLNHTTYVEYESGILPTVYEKSINSLTGLTNYGQGSPIFDMLTSEYLVRKVSTSAPIRNYLNNVSDVYYHYAGMKVQGGGRGSLGFATVTSYDVQRNIRTQTDYNQDFPFIGMPNTTITDYYPGTFAVSNALNCASENCPIIEQYSVCNQPIAGYPTVLDCEDPIAPNSSTTRMLTHSTNDLDFYPTSSDSVFAYLEKSVEKSYYFEDSTLYKTSVNTFNYDTNGTFPTPFYGNILSTNSYTCSGSSATACMAGNSASLIEKTSTINTYNDTELNWLLARLKTTQVTASRKVSGTLQSIINNSSFNYDPDTGQLIEEVIEPTGNSSLLLRTAHIYDNYGNETHTIRCSNHISSANCKDETKISTLAKAQPSDDYIYRYKITNYETEWDEYVESTVEPFTSFTTYTGAQTMPTASVISNTTTQVISRDIYGSPTSMQDINLNKSNTVYGKFGDAHANATDIGSISKTKNRWCTPTTCPSNAIIVSTTITEGAPTTKKYADQLGREVRSQTQNLKGNWTTVDTWYDTVGRTAQQTNPYIIGNTDPLGAITTTQYDDINRIKKIISPNHEKCEFVNTIICTDNTVETKTTYEGLTTTITKPVTDANPAGEVITKTSDASGKVISIKDNNNQTIQYYYEAKGNLSKITAFGLNTTMEYDKLGRKKSMNDPDKGYWSYTYNALGEQITQKNANGQESQMYYDIRGRMYNRTQDKVWSLWEYDANGDFGLLSREVTRGEFDTKGQGQDKYYTYDSFGRVTDVLTHIYDGLDCIPVTDGSCSNLSSLTPAQYNQRTTYDQYGRVFQSFDASGQGILYQYNSYGYQYIQRNAIPGNEGQIYYEAKDVDQWGNITEIKHHNTFTTQKVYSNTDGMIQTIKTSGGLSQDLFYGFDSVGNLIQRVDHKNNSDETYTYDLLNRLYTIDRTVNNVTLTTLTNNYEYNGNLTKKGSETLRYAGQRNAGPHAVDLSNDYKYFYDLNGNMTKQIERATAPTYSKEFSYTAFDKPYYMKNLKAGNWNYESTIGYNLNRSRYFRHDYSSSLLQKTTHYVGNVEIITEENTRTDKRYIGDLLITKSGFSVEHRYLLKDNLGSVTAMVDETGAVKDNMSFDAWGQRS